MLTRFLYNTLSTLPSLSSAYLTMSVRDNTKLPRQDKSIMTGNKKLLLLRCYAVWLL
jgi:hypothetical protein